MKNNIKPTFQFALLQAIFWASFGAIFAYSSVFLLDKGFTNSQVGYVMAFGYIVSVFLQPLIGNAADSSEKMILHRLIIIFSMIIIAVSGLLLSFSRFFWTVALFYGLLISFHQVIIPLTYSIGMFFIDRGININFGISRAMGSLAYAGASALVGLLIEQFSTNVVIYTVILVYILLIFVVSKFHFEGVEEINSALDNLDNKVSLIKFLKEHKKFSILLIGSTLVFVSYNLMGSYMYQIVAYHGKGTREMGFAVFLGAIFELPALFALSAIRIKYKSGFLLKFAMVFFFIRALATYLAPNINFLYMTLVFQSLGYGLHAGISVYYVSHVLEPKYLVSGQSLMNTTITIGSVLASVIGGRLLDLTSVPFMLFVSMIFAGIGALIMLLSAEEGK